MKIYTAGPISGSRYEEVSRYFSLAKTSLESVGYTVFTPMLGKEALRTELEFKAKGYENFPISTNHAIFNRDRWMVDSSDIIYANLSRSGERVSIGTCMELAWASDKGKHVIVVMQKDNIHNHAFVLEAADIIFETHGEALEYLFKLAGK